MFNEPMTAFGNAVERRLPAERPPLGKARALARGYHGSFSSQVLWDFLLAMKMAH
jgi:hypothetical protein